ncbi:GNAT family N-acetyltransferase [Paenibacillus sp. DMB5]|uniref:GNAT family N-acetyltransferase n=1 Tax=Paenibacillus sp. DMB5 TaxID=1780103 RepID=UPI00076D867B|nr:GNAT family N-acetyltransferase [Paenibacillus sp. DMB5]KUP21482.1 GCN5 family acetyltransferase [Paenibacillus sp. DMB5]
MIQSLSIPSRSESLLQTLLNIWEESVRSTHLFLSEKDIAALRPLVLQGLGGIDQLLIYSIDDGNAPLGFMGIQDHKIEMLFVSPGAMGQGIGKKLVTHVIDHLNVQSVDVNEQNPQALGFYEHMGFCVVERSPLDEQGNPFPILHMKLR